MIFRECLKHRFIKNKISFYMFYISLFYYALLERKINKPFLNKPINELKKLNAI